MNTETDGLGDPRYTLADLASELGVSPDKVQNYWLWLGVPARHPEQVAYSDVDKESIAELLQLAASEELDEATLRSLVRSMGHLAERLATWQIEALIDNTMKLAGVDDATARRMVIDTYPQMVPLLFRQFEHAWWQASKLVIQRHSADLEAGGGAEDEGSDDDTPLRTAVVGFADIVGFTSHTASLPAAELVSYIQAFESRARDIVAESGGRVVKTIGDAVLFLADTLDEACEIALTLAHPQTVEPQDAAVRVGMVCGRILARFGDVFGPTVNLAARLTQLAEPNSVLIDPRTASLLMGDERYALAELPEVELKGVGTINPVQLRINANFEGG